MSAQMNGPNYLFSSSEYTTKILLIQYFFAAGVMFSTLQSRRSFITNFISACAGDTYFVFSFGLKRSVLVNRKRGRIPKPSFTKPAFFPIVSGLALDLT